jgi:hypothetical protein
MAVDVVLIVIDPGDLGLDLALVNQLEELSGRKPSIATFDAIFPRLVWILVLVSVIKEGLGVLELLLCQQMGVLIVFDFDPEANVKTKRILLEQGESSTKTSAILGLSSDAVGGRRHQDSVEPLGV